MISSGSIPSMGNACPKMDCEPHEVRLRVAGRADYLDQASLVSREVEALYTNGPAGGGGVSTSTKETVAMLSTLVPRERVIHKIDHEVA